MAGLVQELRWADQEYGASPLYRRAADEIERLRAENERFYKLLHWRATGDFVPEQKKR